jgi:hypothetical protein
MSGFGWLAAAFVAASVFADLDERRAVYVTEGRDQGTV